jgi:crotonobetainyl-CoA:carnitine CoA-transferase CaiB-like acyl-CoA transferase
LANQDELDRVMSERTSQFTREELVERLIADDVLTAPINEVEDVIQDPQIRHNNMIVATEHPALGRIDVTGVPIRFYGTPCTITKHPPMQGEHTREVLAELGYAAADVETLIGKGLVADIAEMQRLRERRRTRSAGRDDNA